MYCNNGLVNGEFLPSPSATAGGLQAFSNPDMTFFIQHVSTPVSESTALCINARNYSRT